MAGRFQGPAQNKRRTARQRERRGGRRSKMMWEDGEPDDREHATRRTG
jgi:hypothetical protein